MLIKNVPYSDIAILQVTDKVLEALQLMQEFGVRHLPVAEAGVYLGLVSEDMLLEMDDTSSLDAIRNALLPLSVKEQQYFADAIAMVQEHHLSILPVINAANEYIAAIDNQSLVNAAGVFIQAGELGGIVALSIESLHYSISEILKIVENNDAHVLQLNTQLDKETGITTVCIKINKLDISDIVATFQRYEYHVKYYFGDELYTNELKSNYENLMTYLNV